MYQIVNDAVWDIRCVLHRKNVTPTHEKSFRETNSLVYYLKGGHRFWFRGEMLDARQGDVVLLPYGACYKNLSHGADTEYFQIEFHAIRDGEKTALCSAPMKPDTAQAAAALPELFRQAYSRWLRQTPGSRLLCLATLLEIFGVLEMARENAQNGFAEQKAIAPAVAYIREHYQQNTSIAQLAELSFVSVSFLEKAFVKCYGMTPTAYRNRARVDRAKQLLSWGHSIEETAGMVGFSDRYYFTRVFRHIAGVTPGEFVRMYSV